MWQYKHIFVKILPFCEGQVGKVGQTYRIEKECTHADILNGLILLLQLQRILAYYYTKRTNQTRTSEALQSFLTSLHSALGTDLRKTFITFTFLCVQIPRQRSPQSRGGMEARPTALQKLHREKKQLAVSPGPHLNWQLRHRRKNKPTA